MTFLTTIFAPFVAIGIMLGGLLAPEPQPKLGASELVPNTIAFFETTLAVGITSTSTDITLTSATDGDGNTLASSTYAFVIDEGTGNEEIIMADCTGTFCTNAIRGISTVDGRTEVAALKQNHRRGASIKITDAPILMLVARALRGEAIVNYTPDEGGDLATKDYVDGVALGGGAVPATLTDDGIVELATGTEAASSTATGQSGSPLVLHTGISTSTAPTSGAYVVVTGQDGNIDDGLLASTSVTQYAIWRASTTIFAATTTAHSATSTYTKPSGLKWIVLKMVGGGGGGGGADFDDTVVRPGGASGGYIEKIISASALQATTTVVAGAAGTAGGCAASPTSGGTGGTSTFGGMATTTGGGGGYSSGDTPQGVGGTASGGDLNIDGYSAGLMQQTTQDFGASLGANTPIGNGGHVYTNNGSGYKSPSGYGAGGSGSYEYSTNSCSGPSAGGYGAIIITEYF